MKLNLPFSSRSTADLVRKSIKNQQYWSERLQGIGGFELETGRGVSLDQLAGLPCFGDDEQSQTSLPAAAIGELTEAVQAHLAIHSEIENQHPEIWAFWGESSAKFVTGSDDPDAELSSLVKSLDALGVNDFARLDAQGLSALRRVSNWSAAGTLVDMEDTWDRHSVTLKSGGDSLRLRLDTDLGEAGIQVEDGDAQRLAALLEGYQTAFNDYERRKALEADLDDLAARLKHTLRECRNLHSQLSGQVEDAMQRFDACRSRERQSMR